MIKIEKKKFLTITLVAVVGIIISARLLQNVQKSFFKKKEAPKKAAEISFAEEAPLVKVYKVKRVDFKDTLPAMGNIKGFREIGLKFEVSGVVESFNFEEGEKVQEGDIVASLNQKDALLKLKYSEIEYKKNQKLFELGAINQMKLDQSKLEYESAKRELDKTNIYALSNGYLGSKQMDVGSYYNTGEGQNEIGTFISIDKVLAEFNIIEKDMPKIALGQRVEIFADAFPTKSFEGTIDRIAPIVEGRSRTQSATVEMENKDHLLKPGMFIRGLIATYEKKDAIVVPSSSVKKREKENEYVVFVVHKEEPKEEKPEEKKAKEKKGFSLFGKKKEAKKPAPEVAAEKPAEYGLIEVRKIKPGYVTQDAFEIEEGLKEEEVIVAEVQEDFKDKTKVEVTEVQEGII